MNSKQIDLEVFVSDENEVYVRFIGFDTDKEADDYAEFLAKNLPLLLFETKVIH